MHGTANTWHRSLQQYMREEGGGEPAYTNADARRVRWRGSRERTHQGAAARSASAGQRSASFKRHRCTNRQTVRSDWASMITMLQNANPKPDALGTLYKVLVYRVSLLPYELLLSSRSLLPNLFRTTEAQRDTTRAITALTHEATRQLLGEGIAQLVPKLPCKGSCTTRSQHGTRTRTGTRTRAAARASRFSSLFLGPTSAVCFYNSSMYYSHDPARRVLSALPSWAKEGGFARTCTLSRCRRSPR